MAILNNIEGGVKSVGYEQSSEQKNYYYSNPKKINRQFSKLRIGEIVQGLIVNDPEDNIADVRLPVGIYSAYLHGKLIKGDQLFFRIDDIQSTLVLKIHSVSIYKHKTLISEDEILRMLDLPNTQEFFQIVKEYTALKSQIIRDEILICYKFLSNLNWNNDEKSLETYLIQTSIFLTDMGLSGSKETFEIYAPFFKGQLNYSNSIDNIKNNIANLDLNSQDEFLKYLNKNSNATLPIKRLSVVV